MRNTSRRLLWLLVPSLLWIAGCVTQSASGAGTSYHYQWSLPIGIFIGGVLCVPIGLVLRSSSARFGWGLTILGPLAALIFAPSLMMERTTVDEQGFHVRSGFFGATATQDVAFDSVASMRVTQETTGSRRSRRQIEVLYFSMKSGPEVRLPLNNDVKIEAAKDIVTRLRQRAIPMSAP